MVKIIMDSSAVNRLIGGDTELEIEVRQNIAQAFAKRHLKGILDEEIIEDIKTSLQSKAESCIRELFAEQVKVHPWRIEYVLNDSVKKQIKDLAKDVLKEQFDSFLEDKIMEAFTEVKSEFQNNISRRLRNLLSSLVKETHSRILQKAALVVKNSTTEYLIGEEDV